MPILRPRLWAGHLTNPPDGNCKLKIENCKFLLALTFLTIGGCIGPLARIDLEADLLIQERQGATVGPDAPNDPGRVPETVVAIDGKNDPYQYTPTTTNPAATNLPARKAEGRGPQRGQIPKMLDPEQGGIQMNLDAVLGHAIGHGREYRNRKEELFLTALDLLIERHLWGPRFFNDLTATFTGTPEDGDHDHVSELLNEFRVTQRLPYGGEVSVKALVGLVNVLHNASGTSPEHSQDAQIALSATLPLLRGAGMVTREDLIQAERNLIYATRSFERFRREFLVQIAVDYFNLIAQQDGITNLNRQVTSLDRLARRFEALAEAGREPYFEAERAAAEVLFARNDLANAEEQYASSLDALKIRIGLPTTQPMIIVPEEIDVPEPRLERIESVRTALSNRLDLQTVRDQVDDARRQVKVAKNGLLPDLELFADVSIPTDPDKDYGGLALSTSDTTYSGGVRFGTPLDRKIEWVRYRQSLVQLERSHRSYTLQRDEVAQQVRSSIRRIHQAHFTLSLQERNVALAQRRQLGVILRERELGPRDVIEAEEGLLEARNRRDDAVRALRESVLEYLLDTGQMRIDRAGQWLPPAALTRPNKPAGPDAPQAPPDAKAEQT